MSNTKSHGDIHIGSKSTNSQQVVYFASTFPYIMMTVMVIRGVTLNGASLGIEYYLTPDFNRLSDSIVSAKDDKLINHTKMVKLFQPKKVLLQ